MNTVMSPLDGRNGLVIGLDLDLTLVNTLSRIEACPGAGTLLQEIAALPGSAVVITSRLPSIARAILHQCSLHPFGVVGGVSGEGKAPAMLEHKIALYAGDHPLDMVGAQAAGVPAVGITTGSHDREQLKEAGAVVVFDTLEQFSVWLRTNVHGGPNPRLPGPAC